MEVWNYTCSYNHAVAIGYISDNNSCNHMNVHDYTELAIHIFNVALLVSLAPQKFASTLVRVENFRFMVYMQACPAHNFSFFMIGGKKITHHLIFTVLYVNRSLKFLATTFLKANG